jgi:hypothetical protein
LRSVRSSLPGLDPAIHHLREEMDHPKSGLSDFGHFKRTSRIKSDLWGRSPRVTHETWIKTKWKPL